jgi:ATP-dependent Lon protease
VILPLENAHDLDELPPETKKEMTFVLVDHVEEVLAEAFAEKGSARRIRHASSLRQAAAARR